MLKFCLILEEEGTPFPDPSAQHMLEFKLKVKCTRNRKSPQDSEDANELYQCHKGMYDNVDMASLVLDVVTTDDMKWIPIEEQDKMV